MPSADVAVIGGGPAGLASALLAARAGHQVVLLEASPRLGGMAASVEVGGQRVDLGSHRLHPAAPPRVMRLLEELLGADLQVRERHGRLRLADRWVGFPLRAGDLVRSLPPSLAGRIGWDLMTGWRRRDPVEASYADVVASRLGPTVLSAFHGPYARKLWGLDPSMLDGELARRRIALRGAGDVLTRLRRSSAAGGRTFLYPRLGYGQITERLTEAAVEAGVEIRTSTVAREVVTSSADVELAIPGSQPLQAGRVLWTAPPTALADATGRPPPSVMHRGVALVYLVVDRPRWLEWDAHYIPDLDVPFVRLSEPKNYRDGPDPAGRTVLCAEVACQADDELWSTADADLARFVVDGIQRLGLPAPAPIDHAVIRLPTVYPLVPLGWRAETDAASAGLSAIPGVTLLGRQGLAVADNLHHVIDMAFDAVACLRPAGGWDAAGWDAARRRFAGFVVED